MNADEVIHQLESLIDNSNSFHEEQNDIWEQDVKALKIAIRAVKENQVLKLELEKYHNGKDAFTWTKK
ncbi:MAG: hypothetical protein LKJ75_02470 [Clostridia bacterium]|jgi:hypothetical protein|nr:hypothetical protein [Clostridia bacterium]MCI2014048.1 hypothetical protein [Clostridia bacterium]